MRSIGTFARGAYPERFGGASWRRIRVSLAWPLPRNGVEPCHATALQRRVLAAYLRSLDSLSLFSLKDARGNARHCFPKTSPRSGKAAEPLGRAPTATAEWPLRGNAATTKS
jgi:hypothetical protein